MLVATWYEKELKACPEKIFLNFPNGIDLLRSKKLFGCKRII